MADIFVSYAHKDIQLVGQITGLLDKSGCHYWMDRHNLKGGDRFTKEISKAISECQVFLLLLSSVSNASDSVRREVQLAYKKKKKIVILRLEPVEPSPEIEYELAGIQWIDISNPDWQTDLIQALEVPHQYIVDSGRWPAWLISVAIVVTLLVFAVIVVTGYQYYSSRTRMLWNFNDNAQAWLAQMDTKPEDSATGAQWVANTGSLQADFDFGQVLAGTLPGGVEPRATYFVKVPIEDWSSFRTLEFDVENLSTHDLKAIFSVSEGGCWYEYGVYQNLPKLARTRLKYDLTKSIYKTCDHTKVFNNSPPPYQGIWRFDIIVGTDEKPYKGVTGSILINDIRLTDQISP